MNQTVVTLIRVVAIQLTAAQLVQVLQFSKTNKNTFSSIQSCASCRNYHKTFFLSETYTHDRRKPKLFYFRKCQNTRGSDGCQWLYNLMAQEASTSGYTQSWRHLSLRLTGGIDSCKGVRYTQRKVVANSHHYVVIKQLTTAGRISVLTHKLLSRYQLGHKGE